MGEVADMMLGGILCAQCGGVLNCTDKEDRKDSCEDMGIPMYCSKECAKDAGADKAQVCWH